jgi:hypothetical protein
MPSISGQKALGIQYRPTIAVSNVEHSHKKVLPMKNAAAIY